MGDPHSVFDRGRDLAFEIFPSSSFFADYANLCGALGERVVNDGQLEPALERALAHDGPSLVEVMSDADLI